MMLLLVSCGEARRSSGKKKATLTQDQIQEIMDHQILTCAGIGGHPCPAGVSRLLTLDQLSADDSYVCSGFMVGPNTLVTNHHCISTIEQCRNTYIAIYDGSSYLQTRCKSIIESQEDYADENDPHRKIDFVVIETVDSYFGTTFELSPSQAQVGDTITAWVVDHIGLDRPLASEQNPYEARITEFSCKVMNQTDSDSLVLETCPIIYGNSGSPILNSLGQVVGVIWGATEAGVNSNMDLALRRSLSGLGIATETIYFKDYVSL